MNYLSKIYNGKSVFYGDIHEHSASGGTSDGLCTLRQWIDACHEKDLDFEAILDHRQVRHMYLPEFDKYCFLCGTEPGTFITDANVLTDENGNLRNCIHYNMIFREKGQLEMVLESFPEFEFTGGIEGHFTYPSFTRERFMLLAKTVLDMGGFLVHPHPLDPTPTTMLSDDPGEYVFADFMGIETLYSSRQHKLSAPQYELWKKILLKGHKVFACAGVDSHNIATGDIVTTLYSEKLDRAAIVDVLHSGNFTAGNAGIKMCIGITPMGGVHALKDGDLLEVEIGDVWHYDSAKTYKAVIIVNEKELLSVTFKGEHPVYLSLPATEKGYYRAEVYTTDDSFPIALGNPVWVE